MSTRKITPKDAKPGMIVAEPVFDASGRMLIPGDFRLTPLQITCLARWGIRELEIKAPDAPAAPAPTDTVPIPAAVAAGAAGGIAAPFDAVSEKRALLEQRFDEQFSAVIDSPMMRELKEVALQRLLARASPMPGQSRA